MEVIVPRHVVGSKIENMIIRAIREIRGYNAPDGQ